MADSGKILIHVSNKKAYIWNPGGECISVLCTMRISFHHDDDVSDFADVSTLRAKHRVTGVLTGTLPSVSQQNIFLGLPLLLLPEEVVLLIQDGALPRV